MEIDFKTLPEPIRPLKTKIRIASDKGVMVFMWLTEIQDIKLMIKFLKHIFLKPIVCEKHLIKLPFFILYAL